MPIARRTRMVSIRLSNEEFERLKGRCDEVGARSLSDIAREAMLLLLEPGPNSGPPAPTNGHPGSNGHSVYSQPETLNRVATLEDQVQHLQHAIFRLNDIVETLCCKSS